MKIQKNSQILKSLAPLNAMHTFAMSNYEFDVLN